MFTVENYQISFRKSYSLIVPTRGNGHFDTICEIGSKLSENLYFKGVAYLHPKDSPNKITGKKVALTKALVNMGADKYLRTVIWKAFWKWVESWKENNKKPDCFGKPIQESEKCNNCFCLDRRVNKLWNSINKGKENESKKEKTEENKTW